MDVAVYVKQVIVLLGRRAKTAHAGVNRIAVAGRAGQIGAAASAASAPRSRLVTILDSASPGRHHLRHQDQDHDHRSRHHHRSSNAPAASGVVAQTRAAQDPAELAVPGRHVPVGSASTDKLTQEPVFLAGLTLAVRDIHLRIQVWFVFAPRGRRTPYDGRRDVETVEMEEEQDPGWCTHLTVEISAMVVPDTPRL
jgi:hypothetical protein